MRLDVLNAAGPHVLNVGRHVLEDDPEVLLDQAVGQWVLVLNHLRSPHYLLMILSYSLVEFLLGSAQHVLQDAAAHPRDAGDPPAVGLPDLKDGFPLLVVRPFHLAVGSSVPVAAPRVLNVGPRHLTVGSDVLNAGLQVLADDPEVRHLDQAVEHFSFPRDCLMIGVGLSLVESLVCCYWCWCL